MKNTRWLAIVWSVMVLVAIAGEDVWNFCQKKWVEMKTVSVVDSLTADSMGENEAEESEKYNLNNTFQLPTPRTAIDGFSTFKHNYTYVDDKVTYRLVLDFPDMEMAHSKNIRSWLVRETEKAMLAYQDLPYDDGQIKNKRLYKGNPNDRMALGKCMGDYLYEIGRSQYGDSAKDYPAGLFQYFTMVAVEATEKYVTFHRSLHNYYGGIHGFYTDKLMSYDLVRRQVIDWDYLFLPQCRDSILAKVSEAAMQDERFLYWEGHNVLGSEEERVRFFLEKGSFMLCPDVHHVGLYQGCVVFSYQPYALSCFAAGEFHFYVPVRKLERYMTQRGKDVCEDVI